MKPKGERGFVEEEFEGEKGAEYSSEEDESVIENSRGVEELERGKPSKEETDSSTADIEVTLELDGYEKGGHNRIVTTGVFFWYKNI